MSSEQATDSVSVDSPELTLADVQDTLGKLFTQSGTSTSSSPGVMSSDPIQMQAWIEVGNDGSDLVSDDPTVLAAVADVLSTPASKKFTAQAVEAINDVQDSCADDFALLCQEQPASLSFSFDNMRSLFDELLSSNEDVSLSSSDPVASWYRRHLTEESHHKHAGSEGMRLLQKMKDTISLRHVVRSLKDLFGHHGQGHHNVHRRMDTTTGTNAPAVKPVHEHTGDHRGDHSHEGVGKADHTHKDNGRHHGDHDHHDKPAPPAPANPATPAAPPASVGATKRHLFGEMPRPSFAMGAMPPMPRMAAPMPMRPPSFMGFKGERMLDHGHSDSDSDDDDDDDSVDVDRRLGRYPDHGHGPAVVMVGGPGGDTDSYNGALGFGATGDSCMMINYAKLSTECKSSLHAIGNVRSAYIVETSSTGYGDVHWHGHQHHHPLLFFGILGAFGYFFYKRHQKMKSIRQILNVIDANPALKAQVEAAAGVEIPAHNEKCESCCNAFKCMFQSFGKAAIFVGAFFFIAVTTLTLSGIVVNTINHYQNRACHEHNDSIPFNSTDYDNQYQQCEGPGFGLIIFVVFVIGAVETTLLVYFGKSIHAALSGNATDGDVDAPSIVSTGAQWYPGQIYTALPAESSHGAEMKTFTANTGTSVTVVSTSNQVPMREVRPISQVTML